jgi:hypothetical protein
MSKVSNDHKFLSDLGAGRSEEALASSLYFRQSTRSKSDEQHEFRRLCTNRAFKRAARDQRLVRKTR